MEKFWDLELTLSTEMGCFGFSFTAEFDWVVFSGVYLTDCCAWFHNRLLQKIFIGLSLWFQGFLCLVCFASDSESRCCFSWLFICCCCRCLGIHYIVPRTEDNLIFGKKEKTGMFAAKTKSGM